MNYKNYFKEKGISQDKPSPKLKGKLSIVLSLIFNGFSFLFKYLFILISIAVFLIIVSKLPTKIIIIIILSITTLIIFYWNKIKEYLQDHVEDWRKNDFEKWFRGCRIIDLFNYLESKIKLNIKINNTKKDTFDIFFTNNKIFFDYIVNITAGTMIWQKNLVPADFSLEEHKERYQEFSHMFLFEFLNENYKNEKVKINFAGDSRSKYFEDDKGSEIFLPKEAQLIIYNNKKESAEIKKITTKLNEILIANPNLKGVVDVGNDLITITLFDNFNTDVKSKKNHYTSFLTNEDDKINFAFNGVEDLIKVFL